MHMTTVMLLTRKKLTGMLAYTLYKLLFKWPTESNECYHN